MNVTLIVILYLVGIILSLARHAAIIYEFNEDPLNRGNEYTIKEFFSEWWMLLHLLSWATFLILVFSWWEEDHKYFLKFSINK